MATYAGGIPAAIILPLICFSSMIRSQDFTNRQEKVLFRSNQLKFQCESEGFFADPNDCSVFYRCIDWGESSENSLQSRFTSFKFQCGSGSTFDPETNSCVHSSESSRSECRGDSSEPLLFNFPRADALQADDNSNNQVDYGVVQSQGNNPPAQQPAYAKPGSGSQIEPMGEVDNTIGEQPPRVTRSPPCNAEGFFPIENDCSHFYRCVSSGNGFSKYEFSCGEGTVWDPDNNACNHAWAVQRTDCKSVEAGGSGQGEGNPEEGNTNPGQGSPDQEGGYPNQGQGNPDQEGGYPNQGQGNPDQGGGDPNQGQGNPNPGQGSVTPEPEQNLPGSSTSGVTPSNYPNSTQIPSASQTTSGPDNSTQSPDSAESSNGNQPNGGDNSNQSPNNSTGTQNGPCPSEGFHPVEGDCKKFIRCVSNGGGYTRYEFECAEGTVWDVDAVTCNYPYAVQRSNCRADTGGQTATTAGGSDNNEAGTSSNQQTTSGQQGSTSNQQTSSTTSGQTSSSGQQTSSTSGQSTSSTSGQQTSSTSSQQTSSTSSSQQTSSTSSQQTSSTSGQQTSSTSGQQTSTTSGQQTSSSSGQQTSSTSGQQTSSTGQQTSTTSGQQTSSTSGQQTSSTSNGNNTQTTSSGNQQTTDSSQSGTTSGVDNAGGNNQAGNQTKADQCTEEGFFPSSSNCNKFYRCVKNEGKGYSKYEFNCGPGTVWDPDNNVCNHPWAVQNEKCRSGGDGSSGSQTTNGTESTTNGGSTTESTSAGGSTTPGQNTTANPPSSSGSTSPGNYTTSKPPSSGGSTTPGKNTTTSKPTSAYPTTKKPNQNATTTRPPTANSTTTRKPQSTTKPTTSTSSTKPGGNTTANVTTAKPDSTGSTKPDENATSDGSTTPASTTAGNNTETTTSATATTCQNSTKPASKITCTKAGFYPHPDNCKKFYRCVDWDGDKGERFSVYHFDCPAGTIFDPSLNTCNHEESVYPPRDCSNNGSSQVTEPTSGSSTNATSPGETTTSGENTTPGENSTTTSGEGITNNSTEPFTEQTTTSSPEASTNGTITENSTPGSTDYTTVGTGETSPLTTQSITTQSGHTTESSTGPTSPAVTTSGSTLNPEEGTTNPSSQITTVNPTTAYPTTTDITTISSTSSSEKCPELGPDQFALVCPTGFRRHPKYCNLFYQCTTSQSNEIKVLTLSCTNGTIYDDKKIQCLPPDQAKKCDGSMMDTRNLRQITDNSIAPVPVKSDKTICPAEGSFPYKDDCRLFYKCKKDDDGKLNGFIYQCPEGFSYYNISKRCEKTEKVPCENGKKSTGRPTLAPVETRNIGHK